MKYFWFSEKHKNHLLSPKILSFPLYWDNGDGTSTALYHSGKLSTFEGKEFTLQTSSLDIEKYKEIFDDYILIGSCLESEAEDKVIYQPSFRTPQF